MNDICTLVRKLAVLLSLIALVLSGLVAAQTGPPPSQPNTLTVIVKVTTGSNLPGLARVELARGTMPMEDRFTDGNGQYSFRGLESGEYTVTVKLPNYETDTRSVYLQNGNEHQMVFMLRPLGTPSTAISIDPLVNARWLATSEEARTALQQARASRQKKNHAAALEHGQRAVKADPKSVLAQEELAVTYWKSGDVAKARTAFEAALQMDPAFLVTYLAFADMLAENKDYSGAGAVLLKASRAEPTRAEPFKAMAQIQLDTGHPDKAQQACQLGLSRDHSRVPEIYVVLANAYLRLGDKPKALEALNSYLEKAPNGEMAEQVKATVSKLKPK